MQDYSRWRDTRLAIRNLKVARELVRDWNMMTKMDYRPRVVYYQ